MQQPLSVLKAAGLPDIASVSAIWGIDDFTSKTGHYFTGAINIDHTKGLQSLLRECVD